MMLKMCLDSITGANNLQAIKPPTKTTDANKADQAYLNDKNATAADSKEREQ
jgi:hypothetical protein